ncbi:TetR/AcrR family transcriptional regulator [Pseudomonas sp.]|uniref:TetR/AcrR family transcriptional regulator n=1 Tax=Pseudomonas sp. TaxID=306 RepID=UPI0025FC2BA2|nr:TetR/AcrR family transcriptional regulator [Pseudomonas sp.]
MSRPNDARAVRSRDALRAALLALIETRPLEQIAIRDITTQAGVSYPVFFRRYASKEELLEDIATAEVRELLSLSLPMFEAEAEVESLWVLCRYVDDHRALWTRLLTCGAAPAMRAEFMRIAKQIGERSDSWLPVELAAPFVVGGLFEILAWWLSQPSDYPMGNVVQIIDALVVKSVLRPSGPGLD